MHDAHDVQIIPEEEQTIERLQKESAESIFRVRCEMEALKNRLLALGFAHSDFLKLLESAERRLQVEGLKS